MDGNKQSNKSEDFEPSKSDVIKSVISIVSFGFLGWVCHAVFGWSVWWSIGIGLVVGWALPGLVAGGKEGWDEVKDEIKDQYETELKRLEDDEDE